MNQGESGGTRSGVDELESVYEAALQVPEAFLERVCTPIGLDIGAETPREIAVSIVAQIIAVRHGLSGGRGGLARRDEWSMASGGSDRACPTVRLWYNGPASQVGRNALIGFREGGPEAGACAPDA